MIRPEVKLNEIEYFEFKEGVVNLVARLDDAKNRDPIVIRVYEMKLIKKKVEEDKTNSKFEFNRVLELAAIKKASDLKVTVKLLATFNNGFIYKYVDGDQNNPKLYDLDTAKKTAIKMARLHHIDLNELTELSEKPKLIVDREMSLDKDDLFAKEKSTFDKQMSESKYEQLRSIPVYSKIMKEISDLHDLNLEKDAYGKICFCHNDLNLTNLLIEKSSKQVVFIDFEKSNKNFAMFDIAYHLYTIGGLFCQYFKADDVPDEEFCKRMA